MMAIPTAEGILQLGSTRFSFGFDEDTQEFYVTVEDTYSNTTEKKTVYFTYEDQMLKVLQIFVGSYPRKSFSSAFPFFRPPMITLDKGLN